MKEEDKKRLMREFSRKRVISEEEYFEMVVALKKIDFQISKLYDESELKMHFRYLESYFIDNLLGLRERRDAVFE